MDHNRYIDQVFSKYFINVLPLTIHPCYSEDLEFSDKIILPRSVLKTLQRMHMPMPPQFLITSERPFHNSIYCTSLEYFAEEDFIYMPFWMLSELGYKVLNLDKGINRSVKVGHGLTLNSLEVVAVHKVVQYVIPKCSRIEYYTEKNSNSQDIKRELIKYMFVREDSEVSIVIDKAITVIKILKVTPEPISTLNSDFEMVLVSKPPITPKQVLNKKEKSEKCLNVLNQTKKLPSFKERLPQHLKDLLLKQESQLTERLISKNTNNTHKKNFSCLSPESPRIITQREPTAEIIEKYIETSNKGMETGKSIEASEWHLPSVYTANKQKPSPPTLLTITIPEYVQKSPARKTPKVPHWCKVKKNQSITPLMLRNSKIDRSDLFVKNVDYKYLKGIKLINH